ncbi:hypothetical protein BROUX41_002922 [Berkeleyomyces rouxiae]|uniref:uncharacterized protein n=1 Tax=Berkeleyomyces rouxiae TaxID=2035830 RepID=UPI003B7F2B0B
MSAVDELESTLKSWTIGTDTEACQKRLDILADTTASVKESLSGGNGTLATELVEKVADSCRQPSWREPAGASGFLEFMLSHINEPATPTALKVQILRLTGNSCAERDDNRARVVDGAFIPVLVSQFSNPDVMRFVVPVLYNICVDYEPAQKAVSEAKFSASVTTILGGPLAAHAEPSLNLISKLLGILTTHEVETDEAPTDLPPILLALAILPDLIGDLDDFVSVVSTALSYLAAPRFQPSIIETPNAMANLLAVFEAAHTKYQLDTSDEESEEPEKLRQARWALFNVLSDISALPEFATTFPLDSTVCTTLKSWIAPSRPTSLAAAACISLGNLARSDTVVTTMVTDTAKIHEPLVAILSDSSINDSQLLHAALSFLKNLSIPPQNKAIIGSSGLLAPDILPRIWERDVNPQVQFAAISLTRLLLTGSLPNFARLYNLSKTEAENSNVEGKTNIHRLIEVFKRSDAEPTKMEGARAIAAICRLLHTSGSATDTKTSTSGSSEGTPPVVPSERTVFYAAHSVMAEPLSFLVGQSKFPVLRSEGWFVFALMSRTLEGAQLVQRVVEVDAAMDALTETVTGVKPPPKDAAVQEITDADEEIEITDSAALVNGLTLQAQGPTAPQAQDGKSGQATARVDRENALVMISELTKQVGDDMSATTKAKLLGLIKRGSDLLRKPE